MKIAPPEGRTRELIARSILENGPSSAPTLGERLGLTPAGIRRHLDALIAEKIIEARIPRSSSQNGRGRPSKVFVMTDRGRESFEHSYDDLAISALRFIAEGSGSAAPFAEHRAQEMARKVTSGANNANRANKASNQSGNFESGLVTERALADFLTEEGYAASLHQLPIGVEICQHHCPIAHVAAEFPELCEAETKIFAKVLGTHVQRLATIAHGDGVCTTFIPTIMRGTK